jgi:hypothetical protein
MVIETATAKFLIEPTPKMEGLVSIYSNSSEELHRFFGSLNIHSNSNLDYPFLVRASKEDFAHALIIMVKELDY